ncbi:MAG: hypothetical protein V4739_19110 [Pseudomonadota bacterium]
MWLSTQGRWKLGVVVLVVTGLAGCGGGQGGTSSSTVAAADTGATTGNLNSQSDDDGPLSPGELGALTAPLTPGAPMPGPAAAPGPAPAPEPAPAPGGTPAPAPGFDFTQKPAPVAWASRLTRTAAAEGPFWLGRHMDQRNAQALYDRFTEAEWIALVPTQAPYSGPAVVCPHSPGAGFSWDPKRPNEITCAGLVYSANDGRATLENYSVLSGKTVSIPVWRTANGGKSYLQQRIDHNKFVFLTDRMKDMSQAYLGSKDPRFGRRIALGLLHLSMYLPDYTLRGNNSQYPSNANPDAQRTAWTMRLSEYNGVAHEWPENLIYTLDAMNSAHEVWTALSAEMKYDTRAKVLRDVYINHLQYLFNNIGINNMSGNNLVGQLSQSAQVAQLTGQIDVVEHLNYGLIKAGNMLTRDGMYPQCFSYGNTYLRATLGYIGSTLNFFKAYPPATPREQALLASLREKAAQFQMGLDSINSVTWPDGRLPPFGNTNGNMVAPHILGSRTALMPGFGHAAMGAGGAGNASQVNLALNDSGLHCERDLLSFTLNAYGKEVIGDNKYVRIPGRNIIQSTVSHNTVVVDRQAQQRGGNEDIGDPGHFYTQPDILHFAPAANGVTVTEADGARAYLGVTDRYQRLMAYNGMDPAKSYVVDVFRVSGGAVHDYLVHGSTEFVSTTPPPSGTLSGQTSLNLTRMPGETPLLEGAETWTYSPPENAKYGIFRDVYSAAAPAQTWDIRFVEQGASSGARIFVVPTGTSQVYVGKSPAPAMQGMPNSSDPADFYKHWRPVLMLRHRGQGPLESLFVSVIEPLRGASQIQSVERLPLGSGSASDEQLALRITFVGGRVDTVLVNMDRNRPAAVTATADGQFSTNGRVAIRSTLAGASQAYMLAGTRLQAPGQSLSAPVASHTGTVSAVASDSGGHSFVTPTALPAGTALRGQWVRLTFDTYKVDAGNSKYRNAGVTEYRDVTQMYAVDRIVAYGSGSRIYLKHDPKLRIADGRAVETGRPRRTFDGPVRFDLASITTQ